jgi:peroxiredoxin
MLDRTDPRTAEVLRRAHAEGLTDDLARLARGVGDIAPDFTLPDQFGRDVSLAEHLARGPVVLTFFRGGWCPFCTITLRALHDVAASVGRCGASLIAIAPQAPAGIRAMADAQGLTLPLLSDHGNAVSRAYGLARRLDDDTQAIYRRLGHDIPAINGAPGWDLPMPAGYVIARDGRIKHARVDPRVTHRLEPAEALTALRELTGAHPN